MGMLKKHDEATVAPEIPDCTHIPYEGQVWCDRSYHFELRPMRGRYTA
jgi:hypothetical protein